MPPMRSRARGQLADRVADGGRGLGDLAHRLAGRLGGVDALEGDGAGVVGGLRGLRWRPAALVCGGLRGGLDGLAGGLDAADLRSAPCATSVTAAAISDTARPVSSDVAAICWEAAATVPAPSDSSAIVSASWPASSL